MTDKLTPRTDDERPRKISAMGNGLVLDICHCRYLVDDYFGMDKAIKQQD